jgi:hypothetical protein
VSADPVYEASRNIASFVKACAEAGNDDAIQARRANHKLVLRLATEEDGGEAMGLVHLMRLAYEAGKQVGSTEGRPESN